MASTKSNLEKMMSKHGIPKYQINDGDANSLAWAETEEELEGELGGILDDHDEGDTNIIVVYKIHKIYTLYKPSPKMEEVK